MLVSWNSTEVDSLLLRLVTSLRVISFSKILLKALDSPLPTKKNCLMAKFHIQVHELIGLFPKKSYQSQEQEPLLRRHMIIKLVEMIIFFILQCTF